MKTMFLNINHLSRLLSLILVIIGFAAYWPALQGNFLSDDFVHVYYMQNLDENIYPLFKNFWSNWLDVPTTAFYRPLVSVSLYIDHLVWGWNPFGYHLTNILFHSFGGVLIFLLAMNISRENGSNCSFLAPFLSSALFLLWPLHPEAVYWIIGRVDAQMTFFYLLSAYAFVCAINNPRLIIRAFGSIASFVAALASKEPAVTLPVVLTAYVFFFHSSRNSRLWLKLVNSIRATIYYWLIILGYFVLRLYALGTLGGGYIGGGTNYLSLEYWQRWESLFYLFIPINQANLLAIGVKNNLVTIFFLIPWGLLIVLILLKIYFRLQLNSVAFATVAFLATLVPIAPVFTVASDMQGSRLLYLPSALLFLGLAITLSSSNQIVKSRRMLLAYMAMGLLIVVSVYQLKSNLKPWILASSEIQNFSRKFEEIVIERDTIGDNEKTIVLTGIPDNIYGAQFLRNGYSGFLSSALRGKAVNSVMPITDEDRSGILTVLAKEMVSLSSPELYGVYRYTIGADFSLVTKNENTLPLEIIKESCQRSIEISKINEVHDLISDGKGWVITGNDPWVSYRLSNCFNRDIFYLKTRFSFSSKNPTTYKHEQLRGYWAEKQGGFSEQHSIVGRNIIADGHVHEYILPMATSPAWIIDQTLNLVRIDFPGDVGGQVQLYTLDLGRPVFLDGLPEISGERLLGIDLSKFTSAEFDSKHAMLTLHVNNKDEFVLLPKTSWDPVRSDYVSLRMRVTANKNSKGVGKFYWSTLKSPKFSEDKAIQFDVHADGIWHNYVIPIKHIPTWWTLGPGNQLRLNPYYGEGIVDIKSIKIGEKLPTSKLSFLMPTGEMTHPSQVSGVGRERVFRRAIKNRGDSVAVAYDGSLVSPRKLQLEISEIPFSTPNIPSMEISGKFKVELPALKGVMQVPVDTMGRGMYYLRIAPINANGENFTSDAIALLIEDG